MKILLILSIFFILNKAENIDYCNKELLNCQAQNPPHIKCKNTGKFGPDCPKNTKVVKFSEREKNIIVALHNKLRDQIASGNVTNYKPAARMAKMRWCRKLAEFAELNAKTCLFEHDGCRNTKYFRYAGQNLARWEGTEPKSHADFFQRIVLDDIQAWFNEHSDADMTFIDRFHEHPEGKKIGHFTAMVAEKNKRIGCGAVKFNNPENGDYVVDFSCNYATTNAKERRIYESSNKPGSGCKKGLDCTYTSLCTIQEKYDLNKFDKI